MKIFSYHTTIIEAYWQHTTAVLLVALFYSTAASASFENNIGGGNVIIPLQGTFTITPTGASSYTLPLDLPPAAGGLVPPLSLSYNSAGGSGPLGFGWGIAGLSSITRGGRNLLHDGAISAITFSNSDDSFWLDGQRLLRSGASYYLESDTTTRINITRDGCTFTSKEGKTYTYAKVSRLPVPSQYVTAVRPLLKSTGQAQNDFELVYSLTEIRDPKGNYIKYRYEEDSDNDLRLTSIEYSGNGTAASACSVTFSYTTRRDVISSWIMGRQLVQKYLLSQIQVLNNGSTWCTYSFDFETSTTYGSFLKKIRKSVRGGQESPPIMLKWNWERATPNQSELQVSVPYSRSAFSNSVEYDKGDFNGDGRIDLLVRERDRATVYLASGSGTFTSAGEVVFPRKFVLPAVNPDYPESQLRLSPNAKSPNICKVGDFNGDGYMDLLLTSLTVAIVPYNSGSAPPEIPESMDGGYYWIVRGVSYQVYTYRSGSFTLVCTEEGDTDRSSFGPMFSEYNTEGNREYDLGFGEYTVIKEPLVLDYDKDGKSDIQLYDRRIVSLDAQRLVTKRTLSQLIDGTNAIANYEGYADVKGYIKDRQLYTVSADWVTSTAKGSPLPYEELCAADMNGDGKSEAITLGPMVYINISTYPGVDPSKPRNPRLPPLTKDDDGAENGPIRTVRRYVGNAILINSFENNQWVVKDTLCFVKLSDQSLQKYIKALPCDLNGDGRQDVMVFYPEDTESKVYFGSSVLGRSSYAPVTIPGEKGFMPYTIDADGDGSDELLNPKLGKLYDLNQRRDGLLLSGITDGFQREISIEYSPLSDSQVYTPSAASSGYPLVSAAIPMFVASAFSTPNGFEGENRTTYRYEGARFHLQGRGFLGFSKFTSYDISTKTETSSVFDIFQNGYVVYPRSTTTKIDGTAASELTNSYTLNGAAGGRGYFLQLDNTVSKDLIRGTTKTTTYSGYNKYGIPLLTTVDYGDGWQEESSMVFNAPSTLLNKTLPSEIVQSKKLNGRASVTRVYYTYEGQDVKEVRAVTDGSTVVKTLALDAVGNITSETTQGKTVTYVYDQTKRYVTSKTVPGNLQTAYTYDGYGNLLTTTDANNLTTRYSYNNEGQLIQTTHPDGAVERFTYEWYRQNGATYSVRREYSGRAAITTYYDRFGRVRRQATAGLNGDVVASYEYNGIGQLISLNDPAYSNESPNSVSFTYDAFGRITRESGTLVDRSYSYSGRSVSIADGRLGYTTTKQYDAAGNITRSQDLSTVSFGYAPNGKVSEINAAGSTLSMSYNGLGLRSSLVDPNAGTISSTYNNLGLETARQTAIGSTATTYDDLGRPTTGSTNGEFTLAYSYDAQKKGLVDEVSGNGVSQRYTYDEKGRVVMLTKTVAGRAFAFSYTYDAEGRRKTLTYPNGLVIEYGYNENGLLNQIKRTDGSEIVIGRLNEATASGLVKRVTYGNGLTLQKTYNSLMQVTGIVDGKVSQTYGYETGKLLQLSSRAISYESGRYTLSETFAYDSYNRLTSVTGPVSETFSYASNGNLLTRSSVGELTYDGAKPHAVGRIAQPASITDRLSESPQDITYTAFGKVKSITEGEWSTEFTYGPDEDLCLEVTKQNGRVVRTRYRIGELYEVIRDAGSSEDRIVGYIEGFDGLAAALVKQPGTDAALYYVHKDHLGSVLQLTNASGDVVENRSYDAWGSPRNPENSTRLTTLAWLINRGYTGHEHLAEYRLINMQGRMYDPLLGRFLSPDPFISNPEDSQAYNRYTYAMNNPMMYVDPDGNFPFALVIGAIIGAYIGGSAANGWEWHISQWSNSTETWVGGVFGAIAGAFGGQFLFGAQGLFAGGSNLAVSVGSNAGRYAAIFANFEVGKAGVILQGAGYATAASGGAYLLLNQKLWSWNPNSSRPEPKNYVELEPEVSRNRTSGQGGGLVLMKNIGTGADYASGVIGLTQIGMLDYRMSLPLSSKIGTFSSFSTTYRGVGVALKGLNGVGYVGAFAGFGLDIKAVNSGEIGAGRFIYRTGSLGASIGTGAAIGGPWGAVGGATVGGVSVGGEYIYDNFLLPLWRETKHQIWNFENALKNGWYPGR